MTFKVLSFKTDRGWIFIFYTGSRVLMWSCVAYGQRLNSEVPRFPRKNNRHCGCYRVALLYLWSFPGSLLDRTDCLTLLSVNGSNVKYVFYFFDSLQKKCLSLLCFWAALC